MFKSIHVSPSEFLTLAVNNHQYYFLGVIGKHVQQSQSPFIHSEFYKSQSLDNFCYFSISISTDHELLSFLKSAQNIPNIVGFNLTIPYKSTLINLYDSDELVKHIGAANTIFRHQSTHLWTLTNTDVNGFLAPILNENINSILILGSGGAAKAVTYGSNLVFKNLHGLQIVRSIKGDEDFSIMISDYQNELQFNIETVDLIVNSTPIGMNSDFGKWNLKFLNSLPVSKIYYDLVYIPAQTSFLREVENISPKSAFINGWQMLVKQAELSHTIWTMKKVDEKKIKELENIHTYKRDMK